MRRFYCIWLLIAGAALPGHPIAAQQPSGGVTQGFIVFLRGSAVGREDVTTTTSPEGVVISGRGRIAPPLDITTTRAEVRYGRDWTAESLLIEGSIQGHPVMLKTTITGTEAVSETTEDGKAFTETDKVSPQTIIVPNLFFGTYEALAQRLATAIVGTELPAFVAPQSEIPVRVRAIHNDQVQTGRTVIAIRRYELAIANPGGDLLIQLSADEAGHMVRLTVPAQGLDIAREDVASASARTMTHSNPTDEPITIPALGFNIAGTLTRPKTPGKAPAVVLLSGSGANDRDSVVADVPIMSELAGILADAGFMVVRYDKRGTGQSGGRGEAATLNDYAEDARTAVKYLANLKEVDSRRVAVVGHSEGAWVALLAATRENKIAAVVALAAAASTGAELVLEQQRHMLDVMKVPEPERQAKIDLQKQIQTAVITGKGWEGVPFDVRRQADSPWFQSLLSFDPARVLKDLDRPLLIAQGELDRQVPVAHADRLGELAKKVSDSKAVDVVVVKGVNHLLVPATSGEVSEYTSLPDLHVSKDVSNTIVDWLKRTLTAK